MSERTYSEREIADLIARAAERQHDAQRRDDGPGLTLDEIERIGRETGLDPSYLRQAAAEMDEAGQTLGRQSGHTRTHVAVERWLDAPLTPEAWEDAVAGIQSGFGVNVWFGAGQSADGTVQRVGNAYEWRHTNAFGIQITVTASPRDGRTRLRLRQLVGFAPPTAEGVVYGLVAAMAAAGLVGGIADSALAALITLAVVWAVATPLIAVLDRQWRAAKLRDLNALADGVVGVLTASAGEPASAPADRERPPAPSPEASLLDLDALGDVPPDAAAASRRRQREE